MMADLADGEMVEMKGSGARPYQLRNTGGVYSCTCPAWRNQSVPIERRTCKHLRKLRGDTEEEARVGSPVTAPRPAVKEGDEAGETAPPLLLAHPWTGEQDLTGWWMSEKLDGVRAYWDGARFVSRLGNRYHAPGWFVAGLPAVPLDGELWVGRKQFQRTVGIVRRQDQSDHWREVRFLVFDAPGVDLPFEGRVDAVKELVEHAPHATACEHVRCRDTAHLLGELDRLSALGAEGLMMREPGSRYEVGRSTTLYKVKRFHDGEARVVGHQPGAGRHAGRLGALLVELADGKRFSVGTGFSDAEREAPPAVGSVVSFRYQELSDGGVPRFPSYVGVRHDAPPSAALPASPLPVSPLPSATKPAPPVVSPVAGARRFEMVEGGSSKFWEVAVDGTTQTVRFGRIGTNGQAKARTFATEAACAADTAKLVAEKVGKGYREV